VLVEGAIVELLETGWVNEPAPDKTRTAFVWSLLPDPYIAPDDPSQELEPDPAG